MATLPALFLQLLAVFLSFAANALAQDSSSSITVLGDTYTLTFQEAILGVLCIGVGFFFLFFGFKYVR